MGDWLFAFHSEQAPVNLLRWIVALSEDEATPILRLQTPIAHKFSYSHRYLTEQLSQFCSQFRKRTTGDFDFYTILFTWADWRLFWVQVSRLVFVSVLSKRYLRSAVQAGWTTDIDHDGAFYRWNRPSTSEVTSSRSTQYNLLRSESETQSQGYSDYKLAPIS